MIKKFFLAILDIIAALVIVFAVAVLVVVIKTPAGSVPSIGGYTVLRVVSGSMEPDYPIDAMLFVHKVRGEEIRPGDVISFYSTDPNLAGAVNTHRVVSVEKDENGEISFTTKGDANPLADLYKTPADRLVGKVVFSSITLGKISRLAANPLIFIPFIVLPLAVILSVNLYQTVKLTVDLRRQEEEAELRRAISQIKEKREKTKEDKE